VTPQEQQLLMQLTQRINQTQLQEKDQDAQNLLGRELGANPDALYIMAQTMLVQSMALEQLKSQVAQLQQQVQQARQRPAHTTSFLGRLLGEHDQPLTPAPAQPPYQQPQQGGWQQVPQGAPQYQQAPPQYVQSPYAPPQYVAAPIGQPSFFRGAMQTAAGVAAGALAFEGVESLLHGGFGHGGWGGPAMGMGMGPGMGIGGGFERPVEETVVNNYYDQPGQMGGGEHRVEHDYVAGGGQDFGSGDLHNDGGERHFQNTDGSGAVYSDADYTTTGADAAGVDQNAGAYDQGAYDTGMNDSVTADDSLDNMQIDDSGSGGMDDSGSGFDDGGGGFDNSGGGDSGF
jgi:hypothetical protein